MKKFIPLLFVVLSIGSQAQQSSSMPTAEELKLYKMINEYRMQEGLDAIPLSNSLTYVAQMHCKDLVENVGYLTHAWSNCKYEAGKGDTYSCMWMKPSELTNYKGYGYECAYGGTGGYKATAESSLNGWKSSSAHNNVILNKGIWSDNKWNALGVGILNGYACIWFGEELDK